MKTKRPNELVVGDTFEEPISEEEFHGQVKLPAQRERYRVLDIHQDGHVTHVRATRLSDGAQIEITMVPWVRLAIIEEPELPNPT